MVLHMQAIQGYYDGAAIRPLEVIEAKPNQRVIITMMDDFLETREATGGKSMRGVLSRYANPALAEKEEGAWERAVTEKNGDI